MSEAACTVLVAITILLIKHTVGDYFLQTAYQFRNKGTYGHPGGILHSGIHALLTIPLFAYLPPSSALLGAGIIFGEFVVHYHLDWSKEQLVKRYGLVQTDPWFWYLFGLDQVGHYFTYIAIVVLLLT